MNFQVAHPWSIRRRLILGGALVLAAFVAAAGVALQRAYVEAVLAARYARLQSEVYMLMAAAEVDKKGNLVMPPTLAEPRFSLPESGLYASIDNPARQEQWQSPSTVGLTVPFLQRQKAGSWRFGELSAAGRNYLSVAYGVSWAVGKKKQLITFSASEDDANHRLELRRHSTTLWAWLGGMGVGLLLAQTLLLSWGLIPLRRVAREIHRVEQGEQSQVSGIYPQEIAPLTNNINALIEQERSRQTRYKDALDDLAHSLKTPLAVLRSALAQPQSLAQVVDEQVVRMDRIVQHQLGRAAASGVAVSTPLLPIAPILQRIVDSLAKIYADKHLHFALQAPPHLAWRLQESDLFEMCGNVLDNAAKWARCTILVDVMVEAGSLVITIADDGPGIADAHAVLQRGVRADERVPGHGIGLAVVADIVAAYGGQIDIGASTAGGASVRLSFPARLAAA